MAVNKDPFIRSRSKDGLPAMCYEAVQAGSTQAIKIGEICCFNETAGYMVPVDAAADFIYTLAIAAEEQKAADSARYIKFYALAPEDEFEFELDAARSLALGNRFILTASNSQKLTYSATAYPVARCVGFGHYPETGTTIRNRSYAEVAFNPRCTYYGTISNGCAWGQPMVTNATAALTLYVEQSGLIISNTGSVATTAHVLPQSAPAGTTYTAIATAAQLNGFAPGAAGGIYVSGGKQADNKYAAVNDEGDSLKVTADGNGDWLCEGFVSSSAEVTAEISIQG